MPTAKGDAASASMRLPSRPHMHDPHWEILCGPCLRGHLGHPPSRAFKIVQKSKIAMAMPSPLSIRYVMITVR